MQLLVLISRLLYSVDYQAISSDVLGLRKGLDLVKYEMNKQPENRAIHDFHDAAVHKVARIAETFHRMEADYEKMCTQFGENYKSTESDDIFKPLLEFIKAFQVRKHQKVRVHMYLQLQLFWSL